MRRFLSLLTAIAVGLVGLTVIVGLPAASAAPAITGRLADATDPSVGAAGMTVQLRPLDGPVAGTTVDTDITAVDGSFSLDVGSSPVDEYYIKVVAGRYQGGWVGSDYVEPDIGNAHTWGTGANTGKILANPAFIRGKVVNASSGNPVRGVTVTARDETKAVVGSSDTSNRNGVFEVTGIDCEDSCSLKLNGDAVGYETGFLACDAQVVPTFAEACASPIGRIGKIFLDKK